MAQALNEPGVLDEECSEGLERWRRTAVVEMMEAFAVTEVDVDLGFGQSGWIVANAELPPMRAAVVAADSGSEQVRPPVSDEMADG